MEAFGSLFSTLKSIFLRNLIRRERTDPLIQKCLDRTKYHPVEGPYAKASPKQYAAVMIRGLPRFAGRLGNKQLLPSF